MRNILLILIGTVIAQGGQKEPVRWAVLVGINNYAAVSGLKGAVKDVENVKQLLTSVNGYRYKPQHIITLINEQATLAAFRTALTSVKPGKGDVLFIYFAGHGSQAKDLDGDESDQLDETLVFYDSRTAMVPDLRDDELNAILADFASRGVHTALVIDAGSSGSMTRGGAPVISRKVGRDKNHKRAAQSAVKKSPYRENMTKQVLFSASSDGRTANENEGGGLFTQALCEVWGRAATSMSYLTTSKKISQLMDSADQSPLFQGDLDGLVLAANDRVLPICWRIESIRKGEIIIGGPPLAAMGINAAFRVYGEDATPAELNDPAAAKAHLIVEKMRDMRAQVRKEKVRAGTKLKEGDVALLERAGEGAMRINLHLNGTGDPNPIAPARALAIRQAIKAHPQARHLIEFDGKGAHFSLEAKQGKLQLRGPQKKVRNVYEESGSKEAKTIAESMWQHGRVRALLLLKGEGGTMFEDNKTLRVRATPANRKLECTPDWKAGAYNQRQELPNCLTWNVEVELDSKCQADEVYVGGLILSSDGTLYGVPNDGEQVRLQPGANHTFADTMLAGEPYEIEDHIMLFATTTPIDWRRLAASTKTRGMNRNALTKALDRYLSPGNKKKESSYRENSAWSLTRVPMVTKAPTQTSTKSAH